MERAQRETITAIEKQTESLLNPGNRLINLPTDFAVPSYNPTGAGVSTYGDTNVSVTFNVTTAQTPEDVRRMSMDGVSQALKDWNWSNRR